MRLIRFKTRTELGFRPGAAGGRSHFRVFEAKECVEFSVSETGHGGCTLTAEDGSAAPFVGKDYFEILPEDFALYRFTQSVSLYFGIYDYATDHWIYDIGSRWYPEGSVHAFRVFFRVFHGAPAVAGESMHLQNPDGQIIPEIYKSLIERVNPSEKPPTCRATDKHPRRVLEAFPAPIPGSWLDKKSWECPYTFDSLRVIRDDGVRSSLHDCSDTPVAYLRLVEGNHDKLYYRCSFFGVPRRKLAKV